MQEDFWARVLLRKLHPPQEVLETGQGRMSEIRSREDYQGLGGRMRLR